jgi:[ribosomal protein S5]-alanine N-acetyltransferase
MRTERLRLCRWTEERLADLAAMAALPEVVRYVGDGRPWSEELVRDKHEAALEHWRRYGFGWLAVFDTEFAGLVALTRRSELGVGRPAVELGFWIVPSRWGRGYATEAAAAALTMVFDHTDLVVTRHQPANTASARMVAGLGFERHGAVGGMVTSVLRGGGGNPA